MTAHPTPLAALSDGIRRTARRLGFEAVGIAPLRPSDHAALYRAWIERGLHGAMSYLAREDAVEARLEPRSRWPELRSAVVVAHHYGAVGAVRSAAGSGTAHADRKAADSRAESADPPGTAPSGGLGRTDDDASTTLIDFASGLPTQGDPATGVIARYARGRDYHKVVKKKLLKLLRWVEDETGAELPLARAYVDTGPVLERELARRAGLGWFGRNTMLIDPRRGSCFFLGELLLPFELDYDDPFEADRCGTCRACLDACPTGALLGRDENGALLGRDENGAPVMDARLCISYLTIENSGTIPEGLRPMMGNRVFGCDICQEVCPWNGAKLVQATREQDYLPRDPSASGGGAFAGSAAFDTGTGRHPHPHTHRGPSTASPSLVELMRMTREEWDVWTRGSAMRRAGYAGFKRNAAVAMANWLATVDEPPEAAVAVLREALEDPEPLVREHAAWALERTEKA